MSLTIRFWGVRGSVPTPGPATAGVGGNTSCVEVRCGDRVVLLDAGTGIRAAGDALMAAGPVKASVVFSHVHWDHIQGLPFFSPLYMPTTELDLYGSPQDQSLRDVLETQIAAPTFPVGLAQSPAAIRYHAIPTGESFDIEPFKVRTAQLNHPNGVHGIRLECDGRAIVYATDTEHDPDGTIDQGLVDLARDADVLVYDSQFTPEEYTGAVGPSRVGWGHSTWCEGVRIARAANVAKLVLFHHDPSHDDAAVADIERAAAAEMPGTIAAREGLTIALASRSARIAA